MNVTYIVAFVLGLTLSMMFQDFIHTAYPFDVGTRGCTSPFTCGDGKLEAPRLNPCGDNVRPSKE